MPKHATAEELERRRVVMRWWRLVEPRLGPRATGYVRSWLLGSTASEAGQANRVSAAAATTAIRKAVEMARAEDVAAKERGR